jgi:hypothetical protein
MEKIVIQAIDCYRHDYWKVDIDLLNELNIIDLISEYSYIGNSNTPLNEQGYAYLEIDCDCTTFCKAMEFYKKEFTIDTDTLQTIFDEKYEDYSDWIETLENWDTDYLADNDYMWGDTPEDLAEFINSTEYEEDDEECDEYED